MCKRVLSLYQINYFNHINLSGVSHFSIYNTFPDMQRFTPKTVIVFYYFISMRQSRSDRCWKYPLETRHMEKFKLGKGEAIDWIAFFHLRDKENAGWCAAGCRWHGWPPWRKVRSRREGWGVGRIQIYRHTYPWQCFLFMEGVLGFDGRLPGAVGEECTTCKRDTPNINIIRIIVILNKNKVQKNWRP